MALSSSLLYINVLLLVLIHSSIQTDDLLENLTQRINSSKEEVNEFERNLKTANNNTQQLINKLFEISMQRINSAKEAVDTFERNLKTANNNTQQLIKAVSEFKGSLETTNENIRRLISGVNVFERSLETIDENIRLLINIDKLKKEIETNYPSTLF
ncbi:hypothetical protein EWB00_009338 [Schistosoma japonicum]|uniref:CID domain-containing protein n=1 Tax=Schistosoma japonicum TaxID=6182 RepID=A0A4Z2CM11_SCHJA|nr:hypothetical protein EWB00_009338 [Schistosoma japonicum]